MADRYAILWEPEQDKARPAGLVVEQEGFVLVEVRDDLGIPARYEDPFVVYGPDLAPVQYVPGDPQYFDQVVLDLSRSLIVNNEGSVSKATSGVVLSLLQRWVIEPLRRERQVIYSEAIRTWPALTAYRQKYYDSTAGTAQGEPSVSRPVRRAVTALVAA